MDFQLAIGYRLVMLYHYCPYQNCMPMLQTILLRLPLLAGVFKKVIYTLIVLLLQIYLARPLAVIFISPMAPSQLLKTFWGLMAIKGVTDRRVLSDFRRALVQGKTVLYML